MPGRHRFPPHVERLLLEPEREPFGWDRLDVVRVLKKCGFEVAGHPLAEGHSERWRHPEHPDLDVTLRSMDRDVHPVRVLRVLEIIRRLRTRLRT